MNVRSTAIAVLVAFTWAATPTRALAEEPPPLPPPGPPAAGATPQAAPPPTAVPGPSQEEIRHRRVPVDVEATRASAVLERRISVTESDGAYFFMPFRSTSAIWEQVCVTPCQVDLDRFSTYRVTARNGVSGSRTFTLPQTSDSLQLKVDAGNLLAHRAGMAMSSTGFAAVIVGLGLIAAEGIFTDETKARDAGYITGAAGLVLLAVGIPLTIATATSVSTLSGGKIALTPRGLVF